MQQDKPQYENIQKYVVNDGSYEQHLDFASAIMHGKVGNPKHLLAPNVVKININGEDIDFKDTTEAVNYLKQYIDITL